MGTHRERPPAQACLNSQVGSGPKPSLASHAVLPWAGPGPLWSSPLSQPPKAQARPRPHCLLPPPNPAPRKHFKKIPTKAIKSPGHPPSLGLPTGEMAVKGVPG